MPEFQEDVSSLFQMAENMETVAHAAERIQERRVCPEESGILPGKV